MIAHLLNVCDKSLMFTAAAAAAGPGPWRHAGLTLALKGSERVARPVIHSNVER